MADKSDERLALFATPRDWFRHAVSRFTQAKLVFGHGCDNAVDEAAFIVLEALHLPIDAFDPFADARLTLEERGRLADLIDARIATRKPAAYLLGRAYLQGVPFFVDENTIVPRSYVGELLAGGLVGEGGLIEDPGAVRTVLDLCTGGGSLAILAARAFEGARVDAVELSAGALAVARRNVVDHGLEDRVHLHRGDLYAPVSARRYDLILANPPYVTTAAADAFPPEYAAEPRIAHEAGVDGLDVVRRILDGAGDRLTAEGWLVCEVGHGRAAVESAYPAFAFMWLDTATSEGEVFAISSRDLTGGRPAKNAAHRRKKAQRPLFHRAD